MSAELRVAMRRHLTRSSFNDDGPALETGPPCKPDEWSVERVNAT